MRRILRILAVWTLTLCLLGGACAASSTNIEAFSFSGERGYPTQRLSFRTGPNTRYAEMFTMPQSTDVTVISFEEGNGVIWVLCRFWYDGHEYYGYTGLKRFAMSDSDLPWSDFDYQSACALYDMEVYSAPSGNGAQRGKLSGGELVSVLAEDGSYSFIEFYDAAHSAPSRGWVRAGALERLGCFSAYMTDASKVYEDPSSSSSSIGKVGKYEVVGYLRTVDGYDEVIFYKASEHELWYGYVPTTLVTLTIPN